MKKIFLTIYKVLAQRKGLLWTLMLLTIVPMILFALQIKIDENISSFFPSQNEQTDFVMKNMKAMDKIIVIIEGKEDNSDIYNVAEQYADTLEQAIGELADISLYYDDSQEEEMMSYIYSHLPFLISEEEFARLDSITSDEAIAMKMANNKELMMSPLSTGLAKILPHDPIGISLGALEKLKSLKPESNVYMQDGFMMADDKIVMFISLHDDFAQTGNNANVVETIRNLAAEIGDMNGASIYTFGAPLVAVSNSTQVKKDETVTVSIAIALTAMIILLTFKRKRAVVLIIMPVIYGALFAFAITGLLGLELSLISIGTGAMVLGLAMSYSIHMLTHSMHSASIEDLITEMTYPMTVGSITTIGAFVGLMFTDSKILQDLGIFASLALIGTLLFCLIFMPHFLVANEGQEKSRTLKLIEKVAGYDYSKNRWLAVMLGIITIAGLFFFTDVRFNTDMNNLNYQGDEWLNKSKAMTEKTLTPDDTAHHATLVVTGRTIDELARNAWRLADMSRKISEIKSFSSLAPWFLKSDSMQIADIERWERYWTEEKKSQVLAAISKEAEKNGFAAEAFKDFEGIIGASYQKENDMELYTSSSLFSEFISEKDGVKMLYCNLTMDDDTKDITMDKLAESEGCVVSDMGYFVRKATAGIVDNFNFILLISSALVGLVLLLSYGRFELFVMTFLPMCISWVIILGMMALTGVEFNVVNIILSTFIFGVGDDFSIFIMDGLQSRYKGEKDMLLSHKTAIALSGIAIIVGLGVQVFAQHPACKSIGYLSIFGLIAVILTSYIVQPILFRTFISNPAKNGQPYTLKSLLRTIIFYGTFLIECIMGYVALGMLCIIPIKTRWKKAVAHRVIYSLMCIINWGIKVVFHAKSIGKADIDNPSIIIANHQSFIDIINVLSISPKIVCITKSWVVNSPLFGPLTKYCDFYNADDGSEEMIEKMRVLAKEGYSIVIFPEGTRSEDGEIHRFHKGAFLLANKLGFELTPIVFYGNNMVASKRQPLNLHNAWMVSKVLERIAPQEDYTQQSKDVCNMMRKELMKLKEEFDTNKNPYYREVILHSYVYKDKEQYDMVRRRIKDEEFLEAEIQKLG